ncbi:hypothetical protein GGF46_000603 [Coemansia sp. RSA 552]|nr:hypothetical protein GGF46_000603 [Coemansia sp. RSA 552]
MDNAACPSTEFFTYLMEKSLYSVADWFACHDFIVATAPCPDSLLSEMYRHVILEFIIGFDGHVEFITNATRIGAALRLPRVNNVVIYVPVNASNVCGSELYSMLLPSIIHMFGFSHLKWTPKQMEHVHPPMEAIGIIEILHAALPNLMNVLIEVASTHHKKIRFPKILACETRQAAGLEGDRDGGYALETLDYGTCFVGMHSWTTKTVSINTRFLRTLCERAHSFKRSVLPKPAKEQLASNANFNLYVLFQPNVQVQKPDGMSPFGLYQIVSDTP